MSSWKSAIFSFLRDETLNNLGIVIMWSRIQCCNVSGSPRLLSGGQTIQLCFTLFIVDAISPKAIYLENSCYIFVTFSARLSLISLPHQFNGKSSLVYM